jgi:NADPH:quinone reductase and related Zn-dependent oxidoreductases
MRAALFEKRSLEDLKIVEVDEPKINDDEVLIRVVKAGVNPVDYMTVTVLPVNPLPHIPGREFAGIVDRVGKNVKMLLKEISSCIY